MQALNAVRLTPISVLPERRTEPRKVSQLKSPVYSSFGTNLPNIPEGVSRSFYGSLLLLSSSLNPGLARALTFEEAIQLSGIRPSSGGVLDLDLDVDGIVNFVVENPLVIAGIAAFIALPLVVSQLLSKPKPWGVESARKAYEKLGDDPSVQLLDIRAPGEIRQVGSPDIRGLKKKPVALAYRGENKPGFLKKLASRFQEPENTTLFVLDKFDGNSELVAELVTANGFKAAYAIKDGAEGNRGWMNSGLPWILPKKTLSFDLSGLADAVEGAIGEGPDALSVTLGVAAAVGLGILAFSEVETVLQVLGSAALIQLISKKLLFAEQRKQTLQQVNEFLDTNIAPKELVGDIKQIGTALLPPTVTSKALPAPPEVSPAAPNVQKAEAMAQPPPQINSVPRAEVKSESLPGISRPLSPYPFYPDLKPPSSPSPSQP